MRGGGGGIVGIYYQHATQSPHARGRRTLPSPHFPWQQAFKTHYGPDWVTRLGVLMNLPASRQSKVDPTACHSTCVWRSWACDFWDVIKVSNITYSSRLYRMYRFLLWWGCWSELAAGQYLRLHTHQWQYSALHISIRLCFTLESSILLSLSLSCRDCRWCCVLLKTTTLQGLFQTRFACRASQWPITRAPVSCTCTGLCEIYKRWCFVVIHLMYTPLTFRVFSGVSYMGKQDSALCSGFMLLSDSGA